MKEEKTRYRYYVSHDGSERSLCPDDGRFDGPNADLYTHDTDGRPMSLVVEFSAESWEIAKAFVEKLNEKINEDCFK